MGGDNDNARKPSFGTRVDKRGKMKRGVARGTKGGEGKEG